MDFRRSDVGRHQSWYGMKRHVKRFFGWRVPNAALRLVARFVPAVRGTGRLPAPARLKEVEGRIRGARFVMLRPDRCVIAKGAVHRDLHAGRDRRESRDRGARVRDGAAVFEMLFDNCVRNDVLHRVTLHHVALGEPGAALRLPAGADGSALPDFFSTALHFDSGVQVRTVSLDSLVTAIPGGARVVMKVDVEGTENELFRNGRMFLEQFRPDIVCEVLHGSPTRRSSRRSSRLTATAPISSGNATCSWSAASNRT